MFVGYARLVPSVEDYRENVFSAFACLYNKDENLSLPCNVSIKCTQPILQVLQLLHNMQRHTFQIERMSPSQEQIFCNRT